MRLKGIILTILVAIALESCVNDPSPDGFRVPEFGSITIDESAPGSVAFNCRVSSMSQLADYGLYFTTGTAASKAQQEVSWQKVQGTKAAEDAFSVRIDDLMGGATYVCRMFVSNGRVERLSEPLSYSAPDNGSGRAPMRMEVEPSTDGFVCLPIRGTLKCVVDWGDGSREAFQGEYGAGSIATAYVSHLYELPDASSGATYSSSHPSYVREMPTFVVSVSGTVSALSSYGLPNGTNVRSLLAWGETGLTDLTCAFMGQRGMDLVAAPAPGILSGVVSFREAFKETALCSLPESLFADVPAGVDMTRCFADCTWLESIPDAFLPGTEICQQTFKGCTSLKTISGKLFSNGAPVRELQETFAGCTFLESVPASMFEGCAGLERLVSVFSGCVSLSSLPASLLDPCPALTSVDGAFMNCGALSGESPYTVVDGRKVHLYERNAYPGQFAEITKNYLCFYGCAGLSDYPDMPAGWKKP